MHSVHIKGLLGRNRPTEELETQIRRAKSEYPENLGSEFKSNISKSQSWWKTVSKLMKGKNSLSILLIKHNDQIVISPKQKAELLNTYFIDRTNLEDQNVPSLSLDRQEDN